MLEEMTPAELGDYIAEYHISPWGPDRDNLNAAIGHALLANIHRDEKKRPEPFTPRDFMPFEEQKPKPTLGQRLGAAFRTFMQRKK